jgi:hypothetical protein
MHVTRPNAAPIALSPTVKGTEGHKADTDMENPRPKRIRGITGEFLRKRRREWAVISSTGPNPTISDLNPPRSTPNSPNRKVVATVTMNGIAIKIPALCVAISCFSQ